MSTPESSVAAKPKRPRYPATVRRVQKLSPRMLCVTFASEELKNFGWNGPAAHIKLIFASELSESGPRPTMRTYTPRRFDRSSGELDVEFVIHGEGPASTWAAQAAPGQTLYIGGPGRNYTVDAAADWYLLAGDDTAIPAICTILEELPPSKPALVLLEVVDAAEQRSITQRSHTIIDWLHRGEDASLAGKPLLQALKDLKLPEGSGCVYLGCESGAMRDIRRHLLLERGLDRTRVTTRGYWKLGETDHPDQDYGQDA